ncbi:hypothetical protein DC432_16005 [Microbacterium testaceum]|uniref:Uncharacterized protein n=1 Tax=Microbacterium testaceum TaxID=2033 RepID=A0A2T7VPF8_MICTE|nr:hypothetical protein DC432_16005 [Microbacterium testaceum]
MTSRKEQGERAIRALEKFRSGGARTFSLPDDPESDEDLSDLLRSRAAPKPDEEVRQIKLS